MRFKVKPPPNEGDRRTRKVFAWYPRYTTISEGEHIWAWLEFVYFYEEYKECQRTFSGRWVYKWSTQAIRLSPHYSREEIKDG